MMSKAGMHTTGEHRMGGFLPKITRFSLHSGSPARPSDVRRRLAATHRSFSRWAAAAAAAVARATTNFPSPTTTPDGSTSRGPSLRGGKTSQRRSAARSTVGPFFAISPPARKENWQRARVCSARTRAGRAQPMESRRRKTRKTKKKEKRNNEENDFFFLQA